jgi:hypothetical protein
VEKRSFEPSTSVAVRESADEARLRSTEDLDRAALIPFERAVERDLAVVAGQRDEGTARIAL